MRAAACLILIAIAQPAFAEPVQCRARIGFYESPAGVVASARIAVQVAKIYLLPIYGAEAMAEEQPLVAKLRDGVWTVEGTLPAGYDGGVAEIKICKRNGAVLLITHGK